MTTRQERRLDFLFSSLFIIRQRQNRLGIVRTRYFLRIKHDSVAIQLETQSTLDSIRRDSTRESTEVTSKLSHLSRPKTTMMDAMLTDN